MSWSYRISSSVGLVRAPAPPHAPLPPQGADINAQTEETQETALTLACCGGFLEVADFLIKVNIILAPAFSSLLRLICPLPPAPCPLPPAPCLTPCHRPVLTWS